MPKPMDEKTKEKLRKAGLYIQDRIGDLELERQGIVLRMLRGESREENRKRCHEIRREILRIKRRNLEEWIMNNCPHPELLEKDKEELERHRLGCLERGSGLVNGRGFLRHTKHQRD